MPVFNGSCVPGEKWIRNFKKRAEDEISVRKVENLTIKRAKGLSKEVRDSFFLELGDKLDELGIKKQSHGISNLDEIGLTRKMSNSSYFVKKGTKKAQIITPTQQRARQCTQ